jgi:hypothetical protein
MFFWAIRAVWNTHLDIHIYDRTAKNIGNR